MTRNPSPSPTPDLAAKTYDATFDKPDPTPDNATPRPWQMVSVSDNNDRWTIAGLGRRLDAPLFVGGRVRNEADAALIVEAVNAYDRLRAIEAAARAVIEGHDAGELGSGPIWCDGQCGPTNDLRAALQEGTKP